MGANIRGAGTDKIRIQGVPKLHGTVYSTIPDQIEAGTFMCAAAATGGEILVKNVIPRHLESISSKLIEMGCTVIEYDDAVRVKAGDFIRGAKIKTLPYPGFPTDMQPQMTAVLSLAHGNSSVTESIFENRFKYVDELNRMGAIIKVESNAAFITGVGGLQGAEVSAPDLRAGAALVIAGLAANGFTTVNDIVYIKRGYERFVEKLKGVGAIIDTASSEEEEQKFKLKVG
jgi:UDP-N-acetylglucosamine 1-carboxyvinyltransferase